MSSPTHFRPFSAPLQAFGGEGSYDTPSGKRALNQPMWLPPTAPPTLQRERSRSESPPPGQRRGVTADGGSGGFGTLDNEFYPGSLTSRSPGTNSAAFFSGLGGGKAVAGAESVQVFIRVRPLVESDVKGDVSPLTYGSDTKSVTLTLEDGVPHNFRFNRVFSPEAAQEDVYHFTGRPVIESFLNGFNAAILAYGQTGSGKTHTMLGRRATDPTAVTRGLIPRMMEQVFAMRDSAPPTIAFEIRCSYIELYLDKLADLLAPTPLLRELQLRETPDGEALLLAKTANTLKDCIPVTEVPVAGMRDVLAVIEKGNKIRATATTEANKKSSRSHAIFLVKLTVLNTLDGMTRSSTMYLVDLAGSEKMDNLIPRGPGYRGLPPDVDPRRVREMQKINASLHALGNVINALTSPNPMGFVPFRSSPLTMLLRNSFGGNSRTALIVNLSPTMFCGRESLASLRFGDRASCVKNIPVQNEKLSVEELRKQVAIAKATEVYQDEYERHLEGALDRLRQAALMMLSSIPTGPRDAGGVKSALMRQYYVLRDAVRGHGIVKKIPPTLVTHILSFCPGRTILLCGQVCKEWHRLASSEYLWEEVLPSEMSRDMIADKPADVTCRVYYIRVMSAAYKQVMVQMHEEFEKDRAAVFGGRAGGISLLRS